MKRINEDDLLKQLFEKIRMEEVPDDFTLKVMKQIMINPEIEPSGSLNFQWWWIPLGLLYILSMYLTGIFSTIYNLMTGYFIQIFRLIAEYLPGLSDIFPSNVVILPDSFLLPFIVPGIMFFLILDVILKQQSGKIINQ